jgi:hypothetical protein
MAYINDVATELAIGILIMLLGWLAVATFLRILGVPEAYSFLNL